jgi:hypothetical protein
LKLVQERAGNILQLICKGNDFLNWTQMAQQLKERMTNRTTWNQKPSAQQKKWSPNRRGCPQNGRKSLPAIHLTQD